MAMSHFIDIGRTGRVENYMPVASAPRVRAAMQIAAPSCERSDIELVIFNNGF